MFNDGPYIVVAVVASFVVVVTSLVIIASLAFIFMVDCNDFNKGEAKIALMMLLLMVFMLYF
jgi:hypothetical protein